MANIIPIHPENETFVGLMHDAGKALRAGNDKLLKKVKKEFAEANISLFYNKETDVLRVLEKDRAPVDFPVSQFYAGKSKTKKKK